MIKGRDFCIDLCGVIDILSPLMNMMVLVQGVGNFIWSVVQFWPKVRRKLLNVITELETNSQSNDPSFSKELFPKLNKHFDKLKYEDAYNCEFQGVTLTPGWMVISSTDPVTGDKSFTWDDRSVDDCITNPSHL